MKHLTKIFVVIALLCFAVSIYFQTTHQEGSGIKLMLAAIMFMICAFISRNNDRRKRERDKFNKK